MPAPYNYLSQFPGNAFETALKGYQENLKKQTMESDLAALAGNKTASVQDYNALMLKYPDLQEQLGNSWKMMEGTRRQAEADFGSKALFALENNNPDIAIKLVQERASALRNSGKADEAAKIDAVGELIKYDPNAARTSFKLSLMAGLGAEKYAELEANKAKAQSGGEEPAAWREWSNFKKLSPEEQKSYLSLKRQEQIKDVGGGFSKFDPVTGTMTPVSGGGKELTPAQQAAEQRKSNEAEYKFRNDQNLLNDALSITQTQIGLIEDLFNPDGTLKDGVAKNFGFGQVSKYVYSSEAANERENLKRLSARSFIDKLGEMKNQSQTGASGLGSLTEKEGDKVQAAAAALGSSQSADSFVKNVRRYQKELQDSSDRLTKGFNNIYQNRNNVLPTPAVGVPPASVNNLPPPPLGGLPPVPGATPPAGATGGTNKFMVNY